jgi:hypothetical protein
MNRWRISKKYEPNTRLTLYLEQNAMAERLASSNPVSVRSRVRIMRAAVMARLADLRGILQSYAAVARSHLAQHIEKIDLYPDAPR